jgi:hypothetical protein
VSTIQDHADAFLALLRTAAGSPSLVVFDGEVDSGATAPYALVYLAFETPDGAVEPGKVDLTFNSDVINARAYVHCVGADPQAARAARAVASRVRATVLNKTLTITGRSCFPIRWLEGQPPQRDEDTGPTVMDLVDVYGWTTVPA